MIPLNSIKRILASGLIFILLFTTTVLAEEQTTTATKTNSSGSDGSWCKITVNQNSILSDGCTLISIYNIVQNSGTLQKKFQTADKHYTNMGDGMAMFSDMKSTLWKGGMSGESASLSYLNQKCESGTNWSSVSVENGKSASGNWSFCVGIGNKDFKDMSHDELVTAFKSFWNAGYYAVVGVRKSGGASYNGPSDRANYGGQHWMMWSGVDDNDIYFNDSGHDKSNQGFSNYYDGSEILAHCVLFKNDKNKMCEVATGKKGDSAVIKADDKDTKNISSLGITNEAFLGEEQISSYCRLTESNIEKLLDVTSVDNLSGNQLESLDNWKTMASDDAKQGGFIYYIRLLVQLAGLLAVIWGSLLYIGFWFDRTNNFIDISLIKVLTFGKLAISDNDESCTFNSSDSSSGLKTINHQAVIKISLLTIALGVCIITGYVYKLVSAIINLVLNVLKG